MLNNVEFKRGWGLGVGVASTAKSCQQNACRNPGLGLCSVLGLPVPSQAPVMETHPQLFSDAEGVERLAREAVC